MVSYSWVKKKKNPIMILYINCIFLRVTLNKNSRKNATNLRKEQKQLHTEVWCGTSSVIFNIVPSNKKLIFFFITNVDLYSDFQCFGTVLCVKKRKKWRSILKSSPEIYNYPKIYHATERNFFLNNWIALNYRSFTIT